MDGWKPGASLMLFVSCSQMSRGRGAGRSWGDNGFEGWGGYMAAKIAKLEGQFEREARSDFGGAGKTDGIFQGIAIFVNGYTGTETQNSPVTF